ncbi:LuxR family transcriptional regulator [Kribbella hippodromi]|uniref:LuxR family transcriptional regulator n=1 Tax=Kribbella hippodromi TaxID=434347 RepID=A0ABN2CSF2_9ACTN
MSPGPLSPDPEFVGRVDELARLAVPATAVRAGRHQTVLVQGPPGIGKSGLIRRFVSSLDDFTVLSAAGDQAESLLELGLIDQLLTQVPADVRAHTASLGTGAPAGANPLAVGSQLLDLFDELQRRTPLVLVVDDIQWADHSSLQALRFVLRRMWAQRLLVVLSSRTDDRAAEPQLERMIHGIPTDLRLELGGLDLVDVTDLALAIVGRRLPAGAARRFHSYTGGHPLLLRTILHEISSQRSSIDWRLAVPPSVAAATRQAFDKLPERSRHLLEALAVLGGRPSLAQAAEVAGLGAVHHALGPAIDAGLVTWFPAEPARPVAITHDLQREAVYSAMTPERRSDLHQRAAATVEPFLAWRHRVAAVGTTDPVLAGELETAAEVEAEAGDHGTAATFLSWAADLTPWSPRSEQLLLRSMIHLMFSSNRGRARPMHERATRCSPSALRSLALGLCELYLDGDRRDGERHLRHAYEATAPGTWEHGAAAGGLAGVSVWRGDTQTAIEYADTALNTPGVPAPLRDYVLCLRGTARGRRDGLIAGLDEFHLLPQQAAEVPDHHLEALSCRGALRAMVGLVDAARHDLLEVVRRQEAGVPMLSGITPYCYLASVQYQLGEWDAALQTGRKATLLADDDQPAMNEVILLFTSSIVPSARGAWQTATRLVQAAGAAAQRIGSPQDLKYAAIAAALLCDARGDLPGVLRVLSAVPGLRGGGNAPGGIHEWWSSWWQPLLIDALQATGHLAEASAELAVLRDRAKDGTVLSSTITRLSAQQAAAEGELHLAIDLAESQLRTDGRSAPRLADGRLHHAHARNLIALGNYSEAGGWLDRADQVFTALAAHPYRQHLHPTRAALAAASARRPAVHLTDREREVVALVLRNHTNREIAARLHVTQKTVEYHLRNVFQRLGITSRRELHRFF